MKRTEEREAKFDVTAGAPRPDLDGVTEGVVATERPEVRLTATYFDTPGLRLLRRNVTLRHRRADTAGEEESGTGLWTLKLPEVSWRATFQRAELSWPGPPDPMPTEPAELVRGITLGMPLQPVAEVVTLRRRVELGDHTGARLAEMADDEVTITTLSGPPTAASAPAPTVTVFRQIEVELDAGDDTLLASISARLQGIGATRGRDEPKVRRALLHEPLAPSPPDPEEDRTLGSVAGASIASGLERLLGQDVGVRLGDDPEFVHQARVAIRRLRSDLKTFGDALDPAWVAHARTELKWLATPLGEVRDADVLSERLEGHAHQAAAIDADAFEQLAARLAAQRASALVRLQEALGSARYLQLLRDLDHAATAPPLRDAASSNADRPAAEHAASRALGPLVSERWQKLRRAVERLDEIPTDDQLHRTRIKTKQARYAAEAATPVIGNRAARLGEELTVIQTVLGDHHDSVVAERWFRQAGTEGTTGAAFAAGQCVTFERRLQRADRKRWRKAWAQLAHQQGQHWD
jgi:CHAD domain-containing protein